MAEITGRVGWRNFVPTNNPLWDNLLAYWSGDNTANDSKGTANGTLVNGATYSTGKINGGFSLDGINDFISISPSFGTNLMTNTKAHSYAAWIYPNNVTTGNAFIVQCGQSDNGTTMALSTNKLAYWFNGGNSSAISNGSRSISANTWNHVAISYNGSGQVSFYINGVFDSTRNAAWVNGATSNITRIGAYMGGLLYFNGKIDDVAIWSKALNSTEVTELYNAGAGKQYVAPVEASIVSSGLIMNLDAKNALSYSGTGTTWTDLSGNGNNGTLYNGTSYNSTNGGTIVFDGVNDYVKINTGLPVSGNTLSLWFKQSSSKGAGLITTSLANGGSPHLLVDLGADYLRTYNEGGGWFSPNSAYTPTNWYNVTITGTSTVRNIYMNGVLTATKNNSVFGYNTEIIIGTGYNGYFNGNVPVVHLYNRVLTQAEITANFNALKGRFGL